MKWPDDFINNIICGDCVEVMEQLKSNSIDLTVTSPPYDNIRKYNGYVFDFFKIANLLYILTKPGGVVVWIVGDSTVNGSETGTSFKQALYFIDIGFKLHDTMIYAKKAPVPLTHNRYEQQFEYMFVFSKGKPTIFNPIVEDCVSYGKKTMMTHRRLGDELSLASGFGKLVKDTRYKYNIWYFQKENRGSKHPASFPEALARDHILSWSNVGDLVLDPMCGSGTTCVMAKKTGRNFIGIDISKEYCVLAKNRLEML